VPYRERSDGILVVLCEHCGMGVVAEVPTDLKAFYGNDYYGCRDNTAVGYIDYEVMAEFGVAWAAELVRLLSRPGRVLDIGSANGQFLRKLMPEYECFGIEVNPRMADQSRSYGVEVIADDVFDPRVLKKYSASFDVVSGLAVFEHTRDIRRAVETAAALLKPSGFLIFELPLVGTSVDDDVWFRSSLDHVWYPTKRGIAYLFDALELRLVGKEQEIVDFAATYVGLAHKCESQVTIEERFRELTDTMALKAPEDARFRVLFELVHSAKVEPSTIELLTALREDDLNPLVIDRLAALWRITETKRQIARARADALEADLEKAGDWQQQAEACHARVREFSSILEELEASFEELEASYNRLREEYPIRVRAVTAGKRTLRIAAKAPNLLRHTTFSGIRMATKLLVRGDIATLIEQVRWFAEAHAVGGPTRTPVVVQAEPWPSDLPLVSVVIVCFNYGAYVKEAMHSVLAQTAAALSEVIVVDGGSTDPDTLETMRQLAAEPPPRTRVLLREDGPHLVGDNRNFGIAHARGRYVVCLDADDLLDPRYIEVALYLLERRGYDVVSTTTQCFGESDAYFGLPLAPDLSAMSTANYVTTVAVYRRKLWELAGGYHDSGIGADYVFEDWELWLRIAASGARLTNIQAPLFRYRVHSSTSLSTQEGAIPDMMRQRSAVLAHNADVLTEAALTESKRRNSVAITAEGAFENLKIVEGSHQPTVLFALPFLIIGGAERLLSAVARHLAKVGFRVVVVSTLYVPDEFGDSTSWFEDANAEIYHLPRLLRQEYAEDFLDYLVEAKQVDILFVAGSELAYRRLPGLRQRNPHLRVVDLLFNTQGHVKNNRKYAPFIDLHFCENVDVRNWLLANGQEETSVVLVESGVDVSSHTPIERSATDFFRVGFSGRLAKEKAPLAFIDLARRIPDGDFQFVITGAGPFETQVRRTIARLCDSRLSFLGVVDDIGAHLASLDVLVVPSTFDGRPVVVLEALAHGVPVIASRVGGLPALVRDGETGFLVRPGDTAAIAAHLQHLAKDRPKLEELRKNARMFAERDLDADTMNKTYERALRSLLPSSANTHRVEGLDASDASRR
jgi:O-antigen biosynthesis protein